jgi:hypothetical protein
LVVHEVKSVGSLRYVREPVPGHLGQLQFYLNVLGVENGRLDYAERSILVKGMGEHARRYFLKDIEYIF